MGLLYCPTMAKKRRPRGDDLDRRLAKTLDEWYDQLADFLEVRKFTDLEGDELKKAESALKSIQSRLAGAAPADFLAEFNREQKR